MRVEQRLAKLEATMQAVSRQDQGFFADNAKLVVSVVDEQGNDTYGFIQMFSNTEPYGSTREYLTLEQLTQVKAAL